MHAMAPIRPTEARQCRIDLVSRPAAAGEARKRVRALIGTWSIQVDWETAELLTSELVTNAVRHDAGEVITLAVGCRHGCLRVDVYDSASGRPGMAVGPSGDQEGGRGLLIVETLADEWGIYRTPTGKAVYFALRFAG